VCVCVLEKVTFEGGYILVFLRIFKHRVVGRIGIREGGSIFIRLIQSTLTLSLPVPNIFLFTNCLKTVFLPQCERPDLIFFF
jgi:hypothetical protein